MTDTIVRLHALVRHLYTCIEHKSCRTCPYVDNACDFEYDFTELGIEIDING